MVCSATKPKSELIKPTPKKRNEVTEEGNGSQLVSQTKHHVRRLGLLSTVSNNVDEVRPRSYIKEKSKFT